MSYAGPVVPRGGFSAIQAADSRRGITTPRPLPLPGAPSRRASVAVFAAGAVLGVVVGAGLALLMAPQAGEDTRRAIVRRGRRLARRGHDAWDDLRDEFRHVARLRR